MQTGEISIRYNAAFSKLSIAPQSEEFGNYFPVMQPPKRAHLS
jgi:hypothetical protein